MAFDIDKYIICGTVEECKSNPHVKDGSYIHIIETNTTYKANTNVSDIVTSGGLYIHKHRTDISDSVSIGIDTGHVPVDDYMVISTKDFIKLMKRVDALELRCNNTDIQLGLIETDLLSIKDKLLELESGASSSGNKIAEIETSIVDVKRDISTMDTRLTGAINTSNTVFDEYKTENDTAILNISTKINSLEEYDTNNTESINSINTTIGNINNSISNITENIGGINTSITTISRDVAAINTSIDNINTTVSSMNGNITTHTTDINTIKQNIESISTNVTKNTDDITNLDSRITVLETPIL